MDNPFITSGTEIHGYIFGKHIGSGGFAHVYTVYSQHYQTIFAAKVLPIRKESINGIKVYEREIEALKQLYHPNIIQLYDHFIDATNLYLILEYCPNGSVADLIETKKMNIDLIKKYTEEVLNALISMHQIGLVHHDIKPANILIDSYGRAKLTDFGLSFWLGNNLDYGGSYKYGAPEIIQKKFYDPKLADIWSLGISLYQMFSGKLPWSTQTKEIYLYQMLSDYFHYPPGIPKWGILFLINSLNIQPKKRYSAQQLKELIPDKKMKEKPKKTLVKVLSRKGINFYQNPLLTKDPSSNKCPRCFTF